MNIIIKKNFKTAEELLSKHFSLFNIEIIIPYEEFKKIKEDVIFSLKLRGNYFTFINIK